MALLDAHSHDKDNGDITGTIEVAAAFVYAGSPRLGPQSAENQQPRNRAARLRRRITSFVAAR
jgi:hypothetical protein